MGVAFCKDQNIEVNAETCSVVTKEIIQYQSSPEVEIPQPEVIQEIEEKVIEEVENTLIQGELLKPQPGSKNKYLARWVVMSSIELKYYKNEYSCCFWHNKPISRIRCRDIVDLIEKTGEEYYEFEVLGKSDIESPGKSPKRNAKKTKENQRFGNYSWGCRMKSMENFDAKFQFACQDKETYEKWIKCLRDVLKNVS